MIELSAAQSMAKPDSKETLSLREKLKPVYRAINCTVLPSGTVSSFYSHHCKSSYIPLVWHEGRRSKATLRRGSGEIREAGLESFVLWLPVEGAVTLWQNGGSATIGNGSVSLIYANEPFLATLEDGDDGAHKSIQIVVPANIALSVMRQPRRLCAMSFGADSPTSRIARDIFLSLVNGREDLRRASTEELMLSGVKALLYEIEEQGRDYSETPTMREIKTQSVLDFIMANFCDSDLSVREVANACDISNRYVHYLLKGKDKTFHDLVWDARLNSAYSQLMTSELADRSISTIAYGVGFKSTAHFSRAFRRHFGVSPREFRRRNLQSQDLSASPCPERMRPRELNMPRTQYRGEQTAMAA